MMAKISAKVFVSKRLVISTLLTVSAFTPGVTSVLPANIAGLLPCEPVAWAAPLPS